MEQYYTQLAINISNINQFYSKLVEYMTYIGDQVNITDEEIASYIKNSDMEE